MTPFRSWPPCYTVGHLVVS